MAYRQQLGTDQGHLQPATFIAHLPLSYSRRTVHGATPCSLLFTVPYISESLDAYLSLFSWIERKKFLHGHYSTPYLPA